MQLADGCFPRTVFTTFQVHSQSSVYLFSDCLFFFVCVFAFVFTYSFIPQDMSENTGQQLLVKARFNFQQTNEDELTFTKGDIISVSRQEEGGWWEGTLNGRIGWFPSNYVREVKGSGGCIHFYASSCLILIISNFYRSSSCLFIFSLHIAVTLFKYYL